MISTEKISNKLMWIFLVAFCVFSVIDKSITESSVVSLLLIVVPSFAILLVSVVSKGGRFVLNKSVVFPYMLILDLFCYLSAVWAIEPQYAVNKGNTLLIVLFSLVIFDNSFPRKDRIKFILSAIMWSGYIIVIFAVVKYGWSYITNVLARGIRVDNSVLNANSLGMNAAYAILICIYFIQEEGVLKNIVSTAFSVLSIIVLAASGSKKAILVIIIGLGMFLLIKNIDRRNIIKTVLRITEAIVILLVLFLLLSRLEIFRGINERFQFMINVLMNTGLGDHSTFARVRLIQIGQEIFRNHPILGVGIDNAQVFTVAEFGVQNYYLHNNYIELLADGGIVGFAVYYWVYIILIAKYWKNRDFKWGEYNICATLLVVKLVMDFGMVTYETETNYLFILMFVSLFAHVGSNGERNGE